MRLCFCARGCGGGGRLLEGLSCTHHSIHTAVFMVAGRPPSPRPIREVPPSKVRMESNRHLRSLRVVQRRRRRSRRIDRCCARLSCATDRLQAGQGFHILVSTLKNYHIFTRRCVCGRASDQHLCHVYACVEEQTLVLELLHTHIVEILYIFHPPARAKTCSLPIAVGCYTRPMPTSASVYALLSHRGRTHELVANARTHAHRMRALSRVFAFSYGELADL